MGSCKVHEGYQRDAWWVHGECALAVAESLMWVHETLYPLPIIYRLHI